MMRRGSERSLLTAMLQEGKAAKRDIFDQFDSDEEEDDTEKRVVRSVREKRFEAFYNSAKSIQNNSKIAEWTDVSDGAC